MDDMAIRNPRGDYYTGPAYEYLTPHQLLGVTSRRLIPMCSQARVLRSNSSRERR